MRCAVARSKSRWARANPPSLTTPGFSLKPDSSPAKRGVGGCGGELFPSDSERSQGFCPLERQRRLSDSCGVAQATSDQRLDFTIHICETMRSVISAIDPGEPS